MNVDKERLFKSLISAYAKAYPDKTSQTVQREVIIKWNSIKKLSDLPGRVETILKDWDSLALKRKGTLLKFWGKQTEKESSRKATIVSAASASSDNQPSTRAENIPQTDNSSADVSCSQSSTSRHQVPRAKVQEELKEQISLLKSDLVGLLKRRATGMISEEQEKTLKEKNQKLSELETNLKKRVDGAKRVQKHRDDRKRKLQEACESNPELRKTLTVRPKPGRPRAEETQPLLLKSIIDLAMHGSAAEDKRRSEMYCSVRTLDELQEQLNKNGFNISRSGIYLRLLPRKSASTEGKRHVTTVPVKLTKAQNDMRATHIDGKFCTATISHLEELASFLGPKEVCFISQDDKARVPIGLTAAQKQAPLLMHVEYRIRLPDHDWVVAAQHKLIPSVYAGIKIREDGLGHPAAVSYSGPTYIAIRSGKHSSSTAYSHGLDIQRLIDLPEFKPITKREEDKYVKPVFIITVDGGPDENPRYQKVIEVAIHIFLHYNLDALFIAANAPGRSAYNRVERRMAPLSKELSGVILPHESFGSHLDANGTTIDTDLERKNFEAAGQTLAQIWSKVTIDKFSTIAEYISPEHSELERTLLENRDQVWFSTHVRTSQYCTQISKCADLSCCSSPRSSIFSVLPSRFLPPPIPLIQTSDGLKAPETKDIKSSHFIPLYPTLALEVKHVLPRSVNIFKNLPYDFYCPSLGKMLQERVCNGCHLYFASLAILKKHKQVHRQKKHAAEIQDKNKKTLRPIRVVARRQRELLAVFRLKENGEHVEWIEENELDTSGIDVHIPTSETLKTTCPVFSLEEHINSPWEEV